MTRPAAPASGPLADLKVVELASVGPASFTGMVLADLGADVVRIDRRTAVDRGVAHDPRFDVLARGKRSIALDLKQPAELATALDLVAVADVFIEGFRPGVAERIGVGPDACLERNPALVYGRMTGWGQDGPLAHAAGHDINYTALAGPLHQIGRAGERPVVPLNLVGDMGGGGMLLTMGLLAAVVSARATGRGQVVDAAMVDGAALLLAPFYGLKAMGAYSGVRGENSVDGGSHFYDVYETADGKYVSIGSLEPQFFAELCRLTGYQPDSSVDRFDPRAWSAGRAALGAIFRSKTRDEWCAILEGSDACFAPVLSMDEAPAHPHNQARGTFVEMFGVAQPAPAPRFSSGVLRIQRPPCSVGQHDDEIRRDWLGVATA